MLDIGRHSRVTVGGNGFGVAAFQLAPVGRDAHVATSDYDNPDAFGTLPPARKAYIERRAYVWDVNNKHTQHYLSLFTKDFYKRVNSVGVYNGSIETASKDFATFFDYRNVYKLVVELRKRSGYFVGSETLFEKMMDIFSQDYSHAMDPSDPERENASDAAIMKFVRMLNKRVLDEMSYELVQGNEQWNTYASNMNFRYDDFTTPISVTNKDDGFYASFDFLMPQ